MRARCPSCILSDRVNHRALSDSSRERLYLSALCRRRLAIVAQPFVFLPVPDRGLTSVERESARIGLQQVHAHPHLEV